MHKQNLALLAVAATLSMASAAIASRFEAARTTSELTAQHVELGAPGLAVERPVAAPLLVTTSVAAAPPTTPPTTPPATPPTTAVVSASVTTVVAESTTSPSTAPTPETSADPPVAPNDWDSASVGERGIEALTLIAYPWQDRLPGWELRFHEGRDGAYGYTLTQESVIDIYVRDGQSKQLLAHVVAHELGHALDVTYNDGEDRRRWQAARDIEDAPWWPNNRATDFSTGAGDFAESFAASQVGNASYRSKLAGPPSSEQLALLNELTGP